MISARNKDGFQIVNGSPEDYIRVEDKNLNQYVEYINSNNIKCVTISAFWGYTLRDLGFIKNCPNIEYLVLSSPLIADISPVYNLKRLKFLSLDSPFTNVDLSYFPTLEELQIDHHKHIHNLEKCSGLKELNTAFYNPLNRNLEELSGLMNLTSLKIYRSNIDSFKGIGSLKQLKYLFFYNLPNLHYLDELEKISDNLTVLVFEGCKKIENIEYAACLKKLKILKFPGCGNIPNILFIKQMPDLKAIVFMDSNIVDGDLSPCFGLEYAGFMNKKHYSHKFEDFPRDKISPEIDALMKLH
jgi:protein phosphatase 1 regulatory subunit 7